MLAIRIFSVLLLILSVFLFYYGLDIKSEFNYEPLGPRPFPLATLVLIAFCSVLLLFFSEKTKVQYPKFESAKSLVLLLLNLFCYALLFEYLGFILSSMVFIFFTALIFQARVFFALIFAVLSSIALFYLFDDLLQITLAKGVVFE